MDPNEVTRLVAELKLTAAGERKVVRVPADVPWSGKRRPENMVVGKIFDSRVVNRDALRNQLPQILQLRREAEIEIIDDNLFTIEFGSDDDRSRAISDGPWHFFRSMMIFKESVGFQHPTEILFDDFTTWIQIHNLPINYMLPAVVRNIGEKVGRVLEVEVNDKGTCLGQFARVRIIRPIDEPLQRYVVMEMEGGLEERMALLRYEKLLDFCSACGWVGHVLRHCRDSTVDKAACSFGQWLRASRAMENRRPQSNSGRSPDHGRSGRDGDSHTSSSAVWGGGGERYEGKGEGAVGEGGCEEGGGSSEGGIMVVYKPAAVGAPVMVVDEGKMETVEGEGASGDGEMGAVKGLEGGQEDFVGLVQAVVDDSMMVAVEKDDNVLMAVEKEVLGACCESVGRPRGESVGRLLEVGNAPMAWDANGAVAIEARQIQGASKLEKKWKRRARASNEIVQRCGDEQQSVSKRKSYEEDAAYPLNRLAKRSKAVEDVLLGEINGVHVTAAAAEQPCRSQ